MKFWWVFLTWFIGRLVLAQGASFLPEVKVLDPDSIPSSFVFETPRRHIFDDLDMIQDNPKVKKAISFYNQYFKLFDIDKAAREGIFEFYFETKL